MSFLERETALSYIDQIKRSNCIILSNILNNYWSSAAFDQNCLDHCEILNLVKKLSTMVWPYKKFVKISQPSHPGLWSEARKGNVLNYLNQKKNV